MTERYDAIIIGAGQAGPALAARLNAAGQTVALVERKLVGGTCVNVGCTPTKAMVASAHAAHIARRGNDYGVRLKGTVCVDLEAVMARKNGIVEASRKGLLSWIGSMEHCTLIQGQAAFESPTTVRVGDRLLEGARIFLNVGARPMSTVEGHEGVPALTSTTILQLRELPQHLAVVGGSFIGLEFAQMFRRFGSEVTVVERNPRIISRQDEDASSELQAIMEAEGVKFRTHANCIQLHNSERGIRVSLDCEQGEPEVEASHVLLATGRKPNTDDLNLRAAGVQMDAHGFVVTDEHLRTTSPTVWAMGDCNGRGAFTHTSWNDYEIVADNLLDGGTRSAADRIPAYALFSDPPLAHIGMTESEVRQSGKPALIGNRPMSRVGRAVEKGESSGFMKVLVDAESRRILGATILGVGGDEAIHSLLTCMYSRQTYDLVATAVHIHPTVAELLPTILQELKPLA
ncbi:FAD-containing oxidoreductase [Terriglobus albidus]|uniref:FAD-containing oxidoreductase n=1 Tax=Terriglobus albidus TaxID=1592106 RepID=UPI0021DFFFDB|nr:FAD-containing oxidoreductase [Terriglobus albidus]